MLRLYVAWSPGASSSMLTLCRSSVIRPPTTASSGVAAASSSCSGVVSGLSEMNA